MNRNNSIFIIVAAVAALLAVDCMCVLGGIAAYSYFKTSPQTSHTSPLPVAPSDAPRWAIPTQTPRFAEPATESPQVIPSLPATTPPTGSGSATPAPVSPGIVPTDTQLTLEDSQVPVSDLIGLAERLQGKENIPATLPPPAVLPKIGDKHPFWMVNSDSNQSSQVQATLRYVTDHAYFWVEDGVSANDGNIKKLMDTFEKKIYPTDRQFFGSEWTPGVDSDPHLYILYTRGLGGSVAGYFSSSDEYPPQASKHSNAHEMFLLSADLAPLDDNYTYGILAHEFQHMIHWYRDRNEETWVNEGFSDLAMFLNGYDIGGQDVAYVANPDIQLTDWPVVDQDRGPHYGAAFLFLDYFLDRFGENMTKALVADPLHGMVSIDDVLAKAGITDKLTGKPVRADDVFADWEVASYLHDGKVADGRYTYHNNENAPRPAETETTSTCPAKQADRQVSQYGVDYLRIDCQGDYTVHFSGALQVGVLPVDPHSGSYYFWSNKGDESDMTLTHNFDFSNTSGPLTFSYWTWYDLEKDYDFIYLEASTDGQNWQIIKTPSGTGNDPSASSFGWGYNDVSGGDSRSGPKWIQEKVDLSKYAGKKVQIRFEYVTDPAVNGEGLLLDDVSIPEIKYASDFEKDAGGWDARGFARIQNVLPQTYRLSIIRQGKNTSVEHLTLSTNNTVDIPIHINGDVQDVILVVSGTTRFTRQKAAYRLSITP